jgi:hypothetical protein
MAIELIQPLDRLKPAAIEEYPFWAEDILTFASIGVKVNLPSASADGSGSPLPLWDFSPKKYSYL